MKAEGRRFGVRDWTALVALLGVAAIARPGALKSPFFADDWLFLDQARARSLIATLASPDPIGNFARPLGRQVWFWLMGHVSGESADFFHLASLAVFVTAVGLLFRLGWRLGGVAAGAIAAAFLALHYAADVPLTWACGSQDLLAVALGIGSILAYVEGRRGRAATLLFLGLLSKEVIVLAPLAAVALARRPGEPWRHALRRAWPFAIAWLAWLTVLAIAALRGRAHLAAGGFQPLDLIAALVHLLRVTIGLEWRTGSWPWIPFIWPGAWLALLMLVVAGIALWVCGGKSSRATTAPGDRGERTRRAERDRRAPRPAARAESGRRGMRADSPRSSADSTRSRAERESRRTLRLGATVWALAAALPVAIVAPIWSAYFYLFAMAGMGLLLGAWLADRRVFAALALVVSAVGSHQARVLDEFATARSSWSLASHVNTLYLARGMGIVSRGLADLKQLHPTLPPRSTVFFAGFPAFAAFQVGDGPLLRGAYRDTSLRAYYLSDLTAERATRGPCYFILYDQPTGRLKDESADPEMLLRVAVGEVMSVHPAVAKAALDLHLRARPGDGLGNYLGGLVALDFGQSSRADSFFAAAGMIHTGSADEALAKARALTASGDTAAAALTLNAARPRHVRDASLHLELSRLLCGREKTQGDGAVESYAARLLAPESAAAWRQWAMCQLMTSRGIEARASFEHYFALDPGGVRADTAAARLYRQLVRQLPGGDLAQKELHKGVIR